MRRKQWLGAVFVYLNLELAALLGVPVRPDQVAEMTRLLGQTTVARVERQDAGTDPPPEKRGGRGNT